MLLEASPLKIILREVCRFSPRSSFICLARDCAKSGKLNNNEALNKEAKFCARCGANAFPVSEEVGLLSDQVTSNHEAFLSKAGREEIETNVLGQYQISIAVVISIVCSVVLTKNLLGSEGGINREHKGLPFMLPAVVVYDCFLIILQENRCFC